MNPENARKLKHELRTPVNHILGYSELLLESADEEGDSATANLARAVHEKGRSLATLLEKNLLSQSGDLGEAQMIALRENIRPVIQEILEKVSGDPAASRNGSHAEDFNKIRRAADQLMVLMV